MTKKFFLIFSFINVLALNANSNKSIPGYLGSLNAASIKLQSNFAFSDDVIEQITRPGIGLTYEKVVNRRNSYSISCGISANKLTFWSYHPFIHDKNNDLILKYPFEHTYFEGNIKYRNSYITISRSYYNLSSGSIAPMGFYTKIGYTINAQKITKDNFKYAIGINPNGNKLYHTQLTSSFNLELGSKRFINRNIFIQKSIAFNLPFNFWRTSKNKDYSNIEDFNETNMNFYLSKARALNISISIGSAF